MCLCVFGCVCRRHMYQLIMSINLLSTKTRNLTLISSFLTVNLSLVPETLVRVTAPWTTNMNLVGKREQKAYDENQMPEANKSL